MLVSVWKLSTRFCSRCKVAWRGLAPLEGSLRLIFKGEGSMLTECQKACAPQAERSHKAFCEGSAP